MRIFFSKSVDIYRLATTTGNKEAYGGTKNGTIECGIIGISPDDVVLSEANPAQSAVLYTDPASDIKVTDKVVDGSDTYIVKSIKQPNQILSIGYKRAIIEKMNS